MYRTPAGLFQVPPPVNTCILENPVVAYSKPFAEALVRNNVLAPPADVNPVPPRLVGTVPVTLAPVTSTELPANFVDITAPSAKSFVVIVCDAKLPATSVPSAIAALLICFNV
jgi:hypothetical protein